MRIDRKWRSGVAMAVLLVARASSAQEPPSTETRIPSPLDDLGANVADSFLGWNFAFQLGGVGVTALMSTQKLDYEVYDFFSQHETLQTLGLPGVIAGYAAPFAVVGGLYWAAYRTRDVGLFGMAAAALQGVVLSFTYVSVLKLITGRPPPPVPVAGGPAANALAESQTWRFGFGQGGLIDGWPSSHTAIAVGLGITLAAYSNTWWVDLVGWGGLAWMMYSVVASPDGGHWASDAIAAALMTIPIAQTVGRSFRRRVDAIEGRAPTTDAIEVFPVIAGGSALLVASGRF